MHVVPLRPLGARVEGLDLADLDDAGRADLVPRLRDVLAEHGVVVVPGQHRLDDDGFLALLHAFGDLAFTAGETPLPSHPELNVISNVGRTTPPRSNFHVDTSYVSSPPAYTALRAVQVPEQGGATQFSDQYAAADSLPDDLRDLVAERTITHIVTGVDPGPGQESSARHPILRPHPVTGRRSLYLTTAARCAAVSGLDDDAARDLVARLLAHSTRPENVLDHRWAVGDVVMWDNACVLHRADHSGVVGERVMHRGMVADYPASA